MSHALFVSLSTDIGIANPHAFLFEDSFDAQQWAITKLIEGGLVKQHQDGAYYDANDGTFFGKDYASALDKFQDFLGASEYFHVFDSTAVTHDATTASDHGS